MHKTASKAAVAPAARVARVVVVGAMAGEVVLSTHHISDADGADSRRALLGRRASGAELRALGALRAAPLRAAHGLESREVHVICTAEAGWLNPVFGRQFQSENCMHTLVSKLEIKKPNHPG